MIASHFLRWSRGENCPITSIRRYLGKKTKGNAATWEALATKAEMWRDDEGKTLPVDSRQ